MKKSTLLYSLLALLFVTSSVFAYQEKTVSKDGSTVLFFAKQGASFKKVMAEERVRLHYENNNCAACHSEYL